MKAEIKPTEKKEVLEENLEQRAEILESREGKITVEIDDPGTLRKVPGIESFSVNGETRKGLGGSPVDEQAYARIESRKDAVKALFATIKGYDLRILETRRKWDYRHLKKYNPDIKHLKFPAPKKSLGIKKALFDTEKLEKIEIDIPEDTEKVYRKMLT